jgi:lipoprotein NlpD
LSACSTSLNQAPVIDRTTTSAAPAAPVEEPAKERDPNFYTVKKGDTLIRIALEYGQNYRDLVAWNNLANANDIKVDQVLRVAPPEAGSAAASPGVQTAAVIMPPTESKPLPPPTPKKSSPRAEKRPYSEAALAELQRPDGAAPEKADKPDSKPEKPAVVAAAPAATPPASPASFNDEKLSWIWPSEGKVIATFDEGKNKGIDIAGKAGQQVLAAGAGKVMYAGSGIRGYGNLVIVKHSNSLLSAYAHNRSIVVKEGQTVSKGQVIAEMGDSDSDAVKLHFEIRQQGKPVDPSKFLPGRQ